MADLPKKARCDSIRRNVVRKEREFFKDFLTLRKDFDHTTDLLQKNLVAEHTVDKD